MQEATTHTVDEDNKPVLHARKVIEESGLSAAQHWTHNATGKSYVIVALSVDEVRHVPLVTYASVDAPNEVWTRDLYVFLDKNEDGPRFTAARVAKSDAKR